MANLKADLLPITDWVEFGLDIKPEVLDPPSIKVKLAHSSIDEVQDHVDPKMPNRISRVLREVIADAIIEWDLVLNGEAIPCTEENKRKYLKFFVGLPVLTVNGVKLKPPKNASPAFDRFGSQVIEYAAEPENFLKN